MIAHIVLRPAFSADAYIWVCLSVNMVVSISSWRASWLLQELSVTKCFRFFTAFIE